MPSPNSSVSVLSPVEVVVLALFGSVAAVGGVVWLGVVLASVGTGSGVPAVGVGDAISAVPALVDGPGDPAAAWPSSVSVGLPGPVGYWLATLVSALVAGVVIAALWRLWRGISPTRRRLGVDANARFASRRELAPLLVRRPVAGRFVFGRWGRWLLATENRRWAPGGRFGRLVRGRRAGDVTSIAIVGPTRCGKTAQCGIPGLLDWTGPVIALSVKRDLMDATIARRRALGQVRVFDPGGYLASNRSDVVVTADEMARWSPLRSAHTATGAKRAGEALSSWTPKAGVESGMDFWTSQGKLLFTGLLGAAALMDRPRMTDVARWVFDMSMPSEELPEACPPRFILDRAYQDSDPAVREAAESAIRHLHSIWNKPDERIIASVYATAQTVCDPWLDPNVAAATDLTDGKGAWVDLDWLMNTGPFGDNANTLYLLVSLDDYRRLAPVLAGLLSDLKSQAYEWEMTGRALPAPLLILIDEAGNIPLEWLPEVSSTCAGIGIQLVTIWQSLAQIHESYGRRADTLLTNHATKLFFPGASDDSTLTYASKIVGDEAVERRSWSNELAGGRRSISGSDQREALVPYFLTRLPKYGSALLIHSNVPPAHVHGRPWWKDRRLATAAKGQTTERDSSNTRAGPWTPTPEDSDEKERSAEDVAAATRLPPTDDERDAAATDVATADVPQATAESEVAS